MNSAELISLGLQLLTPISLIVVPFIIKQAMKRVEDSKTRELIKGAVKGAAAIVRVAAQMTPNKYDDALAAILEKAEEELAAYGVKWTPSTQTVATNMAKAILSDVVVKSDMAKRVVVAKKKIVKALK
jgi:hypothetical protein